MLFFQKEGCFAVFAEFPSVDVLCGALRGRTSLLFLGVALGGKRKIVISGYYGFGNLGDEAILSSIIERLEESVGDLEVVVLSNSSSVEMSGRPGVRCIGRLSPISVFREMLGADLVISGGGGLLQDSTGFSTVVYYLGIVKLALMMGKKVLFYAQGVGPLSLEKSRSMVRSVCNGVSLIAVRDADSAALLREIGVSRPPVVVTADPVMAMKPMPDSDADRFLSSVLPGLIEGGKPRVAVSVRPWNSENDYEGAVAAACDSIAEKYGADIYLIPFQISQDYPVCLSVSKKMKAPATMVAPGGPDKTVFQYSSKEMAAILSRMDAVVAMRLHALILAASSAVPAAGIIYDPKVKAFADSAGMESWDLDRVTSGDVVGFMDRIVEDREKISGAILERTAALRAKALATASIAADLIEGVSPRDIVAKRGLDLYD